MWTGLIWPRLWGPVVAYYEHGNEPSGCTKGGEFNKHLTDSVSQEVSLPRD